MDQQGQSDASKERILAAGRGPKYQQWYKVLGVASTSSQDDVKKAYRKLVLLHHPDKPGGDADTFKTVHESYIMALRKCRKTSFAAGPSESGLAKAATASSSPAKATVAKVAKVKSSPAKSKTKPAPKRAGKATKTPKAATPPAPVATAADIAEAVAAAAAGVKKQKSSESTKKRAQPEQSDDCAASPPKKSRSKKWLVAEDVGKVKLRKVVEQWMCSNRSADTTAPDDIASLTPEELGAAIRSGGCVPIDVRDVGADESLPMQGANRLNYTHLLSTPEDVVPQICNLRKLGKQLIFFSEAAGKMGRCALAAAMLVDIFGIEQDVVFRLDGGYVAWDSWLEANRDQARLVEPLALRLQRRRVAAALRKAAADTEAAATQPGKDGEAATAATDALLGAGVGAVAGA